MTPYDDRSDLNDTLRRKLPKHAQDIYVEAFNSAWDTYAAPEKRRDQESREEAAHRVAWSAVQSKYEKDNDVWRRKD